MSFISMIIASTMSASSQCAFIEETPAIISQSGSYCLSSDLAYTSATGVAIRINASNVTLDGQGFCLKGGTDSNINNHAIFGQDIQNVTVRNVCIEGFRFGVTLKEKQRNYERVAFYNNSEVRPTRRIVVENVSIRFSQHRGIWTEGSQITVRNNHVERIGGTVHHLHSFAQSIYARANNCLISENRVIGFRPVGNGEGVGIALYDGVGCIVKDNHIDGVGPPEWGRIFGLWIGAKGGESPYIVDNIIINTDYALGPRGIYGENLIVDAACSTFSDYVFSDDNTSLDFVISRAEGDELDQNRLQDIRETAGGWECRDDFSLWRDVFLDTGNANAAYAAMLALEITDDTRKPAVRHLSSIWTNVAALAGHTRARLYVEKNEYTDEVRQQAIAIYESTKNKLE